MEPKEKPKQYHLINPAFYDEYVEVEPDLLISSCYLTRNHEDGKDLLAEMLDATLAGIRPWPVGITLKRHMRDGMLSIYGNQRRAKTRLVLQRNPSRELPVDPNPAPVSPYTHNPEEVYDDAEGSYLAERMASDVVASTKPGSIEQRSCLAARDGITKVARVAELLGVTPRQVSDARAHLRTSKVIPVLRRYGLTEPKKPSTGTENDDE